MSSDPANLNNLQDIVLPTPPSFWPPAQGFWILVALATMLTITAAWLIFHARQRNAYRRAGLTLLESANTVYESKVILKRVALAVFPREQVAALHNESWIHFLESTCPSTTFSAWNQHHEATPLNDSMRANARTWIRKHQRPKASQAT